MEESLEKAYKFLRRIGDTDSLFFILDSNDEGMIIYSNKQLPGYQPVNGIYIKEVSYSDLPEHVKTDLKIMCSSGAQARYGFGNNEAQKYLTREVLGIERVFGKYCLVPTKGFIETLLGEDDGYKEHLEEMRKANVLDMPIDIKLVHEAVHGDYGYNLRLDLMRELEERGYVEPSEWDVVDELLSKLADIIYTEENIPDYLATRESVFREEIERAKNVFSKDKIEDGLNDQSYEASYIYGRASELYFQIRANPNLWCFVKMMFAEPPKD